MSENRLNGQVAVVTGASSGIGEAIALALAARGVRLGLCARRADALEAVASRVRAAGTEACWRALDITDEAAVADFVAGVHASFRRLDILVNNAGLNVPRRALTEISVNDFRRVVEVNLVGAFIVARAVIPIMRAQGRGFIVNISSVAGFVPSILSGAAYSAAKAGLNALTRSLNLELRPHGIRACVVAPGEVDTPILESRPFPPSPEARATMLKPEDVAEVVVDILNLPDRATVEEVIIRPTVLRDVSADFRRAAAGREEPGGAAEGHRAG